MDQPQTLTIKVVDVESEFSSDWPPSDIAGFMEWMRRKIELIPPEHRENATIKFYGDTDSVRMEICYTRIETAHEVAERQNTERQRSEEWRASQIRFHEEQLEKLKKP